jgi:hypothetical protein
MNRKVKNATKVVFDDIKFDSKLELYCYTKLKEANIKAEYNQKSITLIEGFRLKDGTWIRPMINTPDFWGDDFIIECKGYPNESWTIKKKFIIKHINDNYPNHTYYIASTQKEINQIINKIIENYETNSTTTNRQV